MEIHDTNLEKQTRNGCVINIELQFMRRNSTNTHVIADCRRGPLVVKMVVTVNLPSRSGVDHSNVGDWLILVGLIKAQINQEHNEMISHGDSSFFLTGKNNIGFDPAKYHVVVSHRCNQTP